MASDAARFPEEEEENETERLVSTRRATVRRKRRGLTWRDLKQPRIFVAFVLFAGSIVCLVLVTYLSIKNTEAVEEAHRQRTFFHLTDVELDLAYDPLGTVSSKCHTKGHPEGGGTYGRFLCYTNKALLESALTFMSKTHTKPSWLFVGGNIVAPGASDFDAVRHTIQTFTKMVSDAYPARHVFPVLGSSDMFPQWSMSKKSRTYFAELSHDFSPWITPSMNVTFSKGGFYSASPEKGVRVIVLNTVVWCKEYKPHAGEEIGDDPFGQLAWLEEELVRASSTNERVFLAGHAAPGFSSETSELIWHKEFIDMYVSIVRNYFGVISGQMYGYECHDDARLVFSDQLEDRWKVLTVMNLAPSLSPGVGGNPAVRTYQFDRAQREMSNFWQHYVNLQNAIDTRKVSWEEEYDFLTAYGLGTYSTQSWGDLHEKLSLDRDLFRQYNRRHYVLRDQNKPCDDTCWEKRLCAMYTYTPETREQCLQTHGHHTQQRLYYKPSSANCWK
eukprot:TRINITY_DN1925_c0_g2_i1.p1 TRINITY_DN1925_c0_g2~~TRINITY_DN1925_c0_g2_i1.p1  ORF type:complete len:501 (-),score=91.58 TRINITY_DN1925_c0_g2_i1:401-1903(-)